MRLTAAVSLSFAILSAACVSSSPSVTSYHGEFALSTTNSLYLNTSESPRRLTSASAADFEIRSDESKLTLDVAGALFDFALPSGKWELSTGPTILLAKDSAQPVDLSITQKDTEISAEEYNTDEYCTSACVGADCKATRVVTYLRHSIRTDLKVEFGTASVDQFYPVATFTGSRESHQDERVSQGPCS
jgi:hypothetical protein